MTIHLVHDMNVAVQYKLHCNIDFEHLACLDQTAIAHNKISGHIKAEILAIQADGVQNKYLFRVKKYEIWPEQGTAVKANGSGDDEYFATIAICTNLSRSYYLQGQR